MRSGGKYLMVMETENTWTSVFHNDYQWDRGREMSGTRVWIVVVVVVVVDDGVVFMRCDWLDRHVDLLMGKLDIVFANTFFWAKKKSNQRPFSMQPSVPKWSQYFDKSDQESHPSAAWVFTTNSGIGSCIASV